MGPKNQFGRLLRTKNFLPLPEFDPRTLQPVVNRYTDYGIAASVCYMNCLISVLIVV
jgi:hypothetical protein